MTCGGKKTVTDIAALIRDLLRPRLTVPVFTLVHKPVLMTLAGRQGVGRRGSVDERNSSVRVYSSFGVVVDGLVR